MGRRSAVRDDIFSIFASPAWKANSIETVPTNNVNKDNKEFIRVSIVDSSAPINRNSISGLVLIDIFAPAGVGPKRINTIADLLDGFLVNKTIGKTQFGLSHTNDIKPDSANSSLATSRYSITFNYFEVN